MPSKIFLTSDQHYDHERIILHCQREFSSVWQMNNALIQNHNSVVSPDDIVYHLGDFCLNFGTVSKILPRLHGEHHLVVGNHDHCFSGKKDYKNKLKTYYQAGFKTIQERLELQIDKLGKVVCSHMPYFNPNDKDQRYQQYRPVKGDEDYLFIGHVHKLFQRSTNHNMINVGVDVWNYTPVSLDQLVDFILKTNHG